MNILNRANETNVKMYLIEIIKKYFYTLEVKYKRTTDNKVIVKGMYYNEKKPKNEISKNRLRQWERYKIVPLNIVDQCLKDELIPRSERAANLHINELVGIIVKYERDKIKRNTKQPEQITIVKQVVNIKTHSCTEKTCSNNNHGMCSSTPYRPVTVNDSITYCSRYMKISLGTPLAIGAESWLHRKM